MDKLKSVFSPGSKKDDEVLYGDAQQRRASAVENAPQQEAPQLHPVEGSSKKEHSILGQILNPGGEKFDDQRFGTTATTQEPHVDPGKLQTDPEVEKHEHSILRQVLNPNNAKYDEERFTDTAITAGGDRRSSIPATQAPPTVGADVQLQTDAGKKDHSILRQILNPHGDKYDEQGFGSTAHAVGDKDPQTLRSDPVTNPDSSISRQILNPGQEKYDPVVHGAGPSTAGAAAASSSAVPSQGAGPSTTTTTTTTTTTLPSRSTADRSANPAQSQTRTDETNYGRDAALAGGGLAAAGGAGYYAATRDNAEDKITDRPHPLSDKAGDAYAGTAPAGSASQSMGAVGGAHVNPVGAPEEDLTSGNSQLGRDAVVGAGVAGATGAAASSQLNSAPADVQSATYTERAYPIGSGYHHTSGPHETDIANVIDPHVPGEFPDEQGGDKHGWNNPPLGPVKAIDEADTTAATATATTDSGEKKTLIGTVASAVGLGGLMGGATAASKESSEKPVAPDQTTSAVSHPGGENYPIQTTTNTMPSAPVEAQGTSAIGTGETSEQGKEHHYGRDAGVAAGVAGTGAAGYGVYEATKGRDDTGPASKTIGPHESNIANIVDPRVQPEPEKMKESKTVGPHSSDLANKADPRVQSDPTKAHEENWKRDAAVAGGAGAAGVGAVAATRYEETSAGRAPATSTTAQRDPATAVAQESRAADTQQQPSGHPAYVVDRPNETTPNTTTTTTTTSKDKDDKKASKPKDEDSSEKGEKKHGLLHKILHPGSRKDKDKDDKDEIKDSRASSDQPAPQGAALNHPLVTAEDIQPSNMSGDNRISTDSKGHNKLHKKSVEQPTSTTGTRPDGTVIEPHTGLPMNVEKYGTGTGGTDAAPQISGYHETDPAVRGASIGTGEQAGGAGTAGQEGVAGPDWEAIKKANTPY